MEQSAHYAMKNLAMDLKIKRKLVSFVHREAILKKIYVFFVLKTVLNVRAKGVKFAMKITI